MACIMIFTCLHNRTIGFKFKSAMFPLGGWYCLQKGTKQKYSPTEVSRNSREQTKSTLSLLHGDQMWTKMTG